MRYVQTWAPQNNCKIQTVLLHLFDLINRETDHDQLGSTIMIEVIDREGWVTTRLFSVVVRVGPRGNESDTEAGKPARVTIRICTAT